MKKENVIVWAGIAVIFLGIFGLLEYRSNKEIERIKTQEQKELSILKEKRREKIREEDRAKQREEKRQNNIDNCLTRAYDTYSENWDNRCMIRMKDADCTLQNYDSTDIDDLHKEAQDRCYSRY